MKLITTTALALVAAFEATAATGQGYGGNQSQGQAYNSPGTQAQSDQPRQQQQSGPQLHPSAKAMKAISDLQTAVKNKDYASVPAKVAAAQAVATTKDDRYAIAKLQMAAAVAANDNAGIAAGIDALAASGYPDPLIGTYYIGLGSRYVDAKQFPQAIVALRKALAIKPQDADAERLLGFSLFQSGQKAEAAAEFQKQIQASMTTGQKPGEDVYRLAVQAAFDAKSPEAVTLAQEWLTAYPSPDSWENSVAVYRSLRQPDAEAELDLFRLLAAAGALKKPNEYAIYIQRLSEKNNWNEARVALDAAIAANVISPTDPNYRDLVSVVRAKQVATAADLATATKAAVNGTALMGIGDRYYAMGDYAKAVELYRMATGKPGVDPAVANLHIGMALARAGDKAGATAAFNSVTGPRSDIAKFWLIYLNQKA